MATVIHIDAHRYVLDDSIDMGALEAEIVAAARATAAFVTLRCVDRPPVEVLITAATAVRVDRVTPSAAEPAPEESWEAIDRLYRDF